MSKNDNKTQRDPAAAPPLPVAIEDPEKAYSEESFWAKLKNYATSAGKDVVEVALKLYYTMRDPDTPDSAKAIIIGSLAYFIVPIDAVADLLPGGYVDDWGALMGAVWTVSKHIKQEHAEKAQAKLKEWFNEGSDHQS